MKLTVSRSKNAASLYVTKSMYVNGTRTSKIVEKLGTEAELRKKLNGADPYEWAKKYIEELNRKEKEENQEVMVKYSPSKLIPKDKQHSFNGGYLFLQQLYHGLGLHKIKCAIPAVAITPMPPALATAEASPLFEIPTAIPP